MRVFGLLVLLAVCATIGCGTTTTVSYQPDAPVNVKQVAVLVLDDSKLSDAAADRALIGYTPETGSGIIVAKILGQALEGQGLYDVLRGGELSRRCMEKNLKYRNLQKMDRLEAAKKLDVEGIVTGEVTDYEQAWFFFMSRASVAFSAQCHDVASGRLMWEATAKGSRIVGVETDLVLELCEDIAAKVARKRGLPAGSP